MDRSKEAKKMNENDVCKTLKSCNYVTAHSNIKLSRWRIRAHQKKRNTHLTETFQLSSVALIPQNPTQDQGFICFYALGLWKHLIKADKKLFGFGTWTKPELKHKLKLPKKLS